MSSEDSKEDIKRLRIEIERLERTLYKEENEFSEFRVYGSTAGMSEERQREVEADMENKAIQFRSMREEIERKKEELKKKLEETEKTKGGRKN